MGFTVLLLSLSYQYIAVGTATVINFLYPPIVTVACAIFMHRRLEMCIRDSCGGAGPARRQLPAG